MKSSLLESNFFTFFQPNAGWTKATLLNLADPVEPSVRCGLLFRLNGHLEQVRLTFFLKCRTGGESPLTPKPLKSKQSDHLITS